MFQTSIQVLRSGFYRVCSTPNLLCYRRVKIAISCPLKGVTDAFNTCNARLLRLWQHPNQCPWPLRFYSSEYSAEWVSVPSIRVDLCTGGSLVNEPSVSLLALCYLVDMGLGLHGLPFASITVGLPARR